MAKPKRTETESDEMPLKAANAVPTGGQKATAGVVVAVPAAPGKPSALVDTPVIWCGECLEQLKKLPDACVDLIYIDPPYNSNRNYEVFWGETKEERAFEDRHASKEHS